MAEKKKTSLFRGRRLSVVVFILMVLLFGGMFLVDDIRPDSSSIDIHFGIELPSSASNIQYETINFIPPNTIAGFTIHQSDIGLISTSYHDCLSSNLEDGFMPDFQQHSRISWWTPFRSNSFAGFTCSRESELNVVTFNVLIEYIDNNLATVYIEQVTGN